WASTFYHLQAFPTLEEAVYFTLVSFTTLGYGDVLLPQELRILGGMVAVNGMLNIGVLTALLIETIRSLRSKQSQRIRH
uniref:ion channel n=1 Tax=Paracoccus sp. TaxID=267 RepID=UPI0035B0086A